MLIQTALDLLTPQLTALSWVERFGGVVQYITKAFPDANEGVIYKTFPVSCSVTEVDCERNQRHQELTPDNTKKSVLYWEVSQGLQDNGADGNVLTRRILKGSAKLVGWLNTAKLGVNQCNTAAAAIRSIMPILFTDIAAVDSGTLFEKSRVKFKFTSEDVKDKAIFRRSDYGKSPDSFLLYPYDFFALNVEITVYLTLCPYEFETSAPIICIDNSKL